MSEIAIDYKHAWQRQHWRTLFSAYGRAPFFEHYGPQLEVLIFSDFETLLDFNLASIEWLRISMRIAFEIRTTSRLDENPAELYMVTKSGSQLQFPVYSQVFDERFDFIPNLSSIDLLMNEGPYAAQYLKEKNAG